MNLEVTGGTEGPAPRPYDLSDWVVLVVTVGGFILPWVYVFVHPGEGSFGIAVSATVTSGSLYHGLRVFDDKHPDEK